MQGHVVPEYSQERKVQEALYQAGVSHNAGVVAHLTNIHVDAHGTVYFCHSTLAVAAEVAPGDGGVLPRRVTLEGSWDFPAPGFYDFQNAHIDINGTISIRRTEQTVLVRSCQPASHWEFYERSRYMTILDEDFQSLARSGMRAAEM